MRFFTARQSPACALRLAVLAAVLAAGAPPAVAGTTDELSEYSRTLSGSYLAGRFARAENDTNNAASFYSNALMFDPSSDMLVEQALLMEASEGDWDQAMRLAESLAAMEPQHRMARMFLGLGAFKNGEYKRAEDHFKAASSGPIGELTSALSTAWIKLAEKDAAAALGLLVVPKQAEWAQFYLRYHRALVADAAGRAGEARTAFDKVFKQDGRTLRTALAYGRSLAHAGDIKGARAILKEHLAKSQGEGHPLARALMMDLQPGTKVPLLVSTPSEGLAEVFYGLGESLIGEGAIGVGIVYLQMALYVEPGHPFALAALANAYEANKQFAEAIAVYDRIPKGSPLEPAIEIRKAFNLNSLDRQDEARSVLERLLEERPVNPAAEAAPAPAPAAAPASPALVPAPAAEAKPQPRETIDLGDRILKVGSTGEEVRELQGALSRLGYDVGGAVDGRFGDATRKAVLQFQKSAGIDADGLVGAETLAAIMKEADVKAPLDVAAPQAPAAAPAEAAAPPTAPEAVTPPPAPQAVKLDTIEKLQALDALGNILRSRKLYAEAVAVYDKALAMIPKPEKRHWAYFYARGTSYERLKNWPAAEKDLKKALELYPDQPLVLNYLGYSWIDQGLNLDQGMLLIERAVAVKPDDGYIVDSLGWAHFKRGNYKEAVRYLERAVELRPDDPVLNDHLGDALWKVGREREAKFQWEQALSLKPEPEDELKIKKKLVDGLSTVEKPKQAAASGQSTSEPAGEAKQPTP